MKLGLFPVAIALFAASASMACANAINTGIPGGGAGGDGGADAAAASTGESENDPPHALGIISLGEVHTAGSTSSSSPVVSAGFVADAGAGAAEACGKTVDGCTILAKADCSGGDAGYGYESGCDVGEVCTLDANCKSVCKAVPQCSPSCAEDEECKLSGTKSKCVAKVEFNAGVITLSGDGVSKTVTLRPPYSYSASGDSPFVPEGEIQISASGATEAGFEKFKDTFKTTTFIQTSPALHKLDPAVVFEETGPVPVGWKPGADEVRITVSGNKGSAVCVGDDASGKFDITRKVIRQVWADDGSSYSTPSLSISVGRSKTEVRKDKKTMGDIADLPPVGFLRLSTMSTETFTVQGCATGQKRCAPTSGGTAVCTNVLSDRYNCGQCGKVCPSSQYCSSGTCY